MLPQKQFCSPPSTQHKAYQRDLNPTYDWNSLWISVSMTSPLKQGEVCPECFVILGDATCVWNNRVYTVLWNHYVYTAVTTLLLCILGRFHSLVLCPWFFPCCSLWKIPPEGSGVLTTISLISSQRLKWAPLSKDCWASGKKHWRPLGVSWCYLYVFRDRDMCTAEAKQRQLSKLMHEMVRLSSDAEQGQPAISTGFGNINFQEP